jgi:hypothetical protein
MESTKAAALLVSSRVRYKGYGKCSVQGRQQQLAIERTPATADVHEQATAAGTPATAGLVATKETTATVDIPGTS